MIFDNWLIRHRNRRNRQLHAVGIPLTILAIPSVVLAGRTGCATFYIAAAVVLTVGYVLQFIGHTIEGNDLGELILIKKLLGLPYRATSENSLKESDDER